MVDRPTQVMPHDLKIWVDADACPVVIKKIIYKAANRAQVLAILVSNQLLQVPPSIFIKTIKVGAGFDVADNEIIHKMADGDLVITGDVPLADVVVAKGGIALNPRGQLYTVDNIKQRLSIRNFNEQLRDSGMQTSKVPKLSQKEVQQFANNLDSILHQYLRRKHA
jgi:uncharacterized protein